VNGLVIEHVLDGLLKLLLGSALVYVHRLLPIFRKGLQAHVLKMEDRSVRESLK